METAEHADIVVTSVNNVPVHVRDLVARGSLGEGVVVGFQPRLGRMSLSKAFDRRWPCGRIGPRLCAISEMLGANKVSASERKSVTGAHWR